MKKILSIQSHVAYGYVGNRAAVFPLQLLGYDVIAVNTVQFSNHTGYGAWTGMVFSDRHIEDIIAGLAERGVLEQVDAVLSGYLGDAALGAIVLDAVRKIRENNPDMIFCCDPVMGDVGRGFFVRPEIPPFFRDSALDAATVITPNQFEAQALTDVTISTLASATSACRALHEAGPELVVITSLETAETPPGAIQMLASHRDGRRWIVTTPRLPLAPAPNGAGDLTAALLTGYLLRGMTADQALSATASSVHAVFLETQKQGQQELALIPAQEALKNPPRRFEVKAL